MRPGYCGRCGGRTIVTVSSGLIVGRPPAGEEIALDPATMREHTCNDAALRSMAGPAQRAAEAALDDAHARGLPITFPRSLGATPLDP